MSRVLPENARIPGKEMLSGPSVRWDKFIQML